MNCLDCHAEVPKGARFCAFCGTPLRVCPECEIVLPSSAQFCGICGHSFAKTLQNRSLDEELFSDPDLIGILFDPERPEIQHELREGELTVGAGDKNDVMIDRPAVSWLHALLIVRPERIRLQDSASTNGTYVNSERIHRPVELRNGDIVKFGNVEMKVWLKPQIRG